MHADWRRGAESPRGFFHFYRNLWDEVRRLRPATILEVGLHRGDTARRLIAAAL